MSRSNSLGSSLLPLPSISMIETKGESESNIFANKDFERLAPKTNTLEVVQAAAMASIGCTESESTTKDDNSQRVHEEKNLASYVIRQVSYRGNVCLTSKIPLRIIFKKRSQSDAKTIRSFESINFPSIKGLKDEVT